MEGTYLHIFDWACPVGLNLIPNTNIFIRFVHAVVISDMRVYSPCRKPCDAFVRELTLFENASMGMVQWRTFPRSLASTNATLSVDLAASDAADFQHVYLSYMKRRIVL